MTQNGVTPADKICAEEYVVKRGDSFYLIAHKLGVPLRDLLAANREIHPARLMVGDVLCIPREEDDAPVSPSTTGSATDNTGNTTGSATGMTGGTTGGTPNATSGVDTTGGTVDRTVAPTADPATNQSRAGASDATTVHPGGVSAEQTPQSSVDTPSAGLTDTNACCSDNADAVTIQSGQTVADIQLSHLVSLHTLETANPQLNLDSLRQGQVVCVPIENTPCALPSTYILAAGETLEGVAMRFNLPIGTLLRANPCLAPQDFEEGTSIILPR